MERQEYSLNHIFDTAGIEIYISDVETFKFVYANEKAIKNIGYSMEELLTLTPMITTPAFTIESMNEFLLPLHGENPPSELIFNGVFSRKNGSIYPADIHLQLTEFKDRSVYVAFVVDATEKQHAQDQLRLVIKGSSLGYWEYDHKFGRLFVDDQWLDMVGLKREDVKNDPTYWHKYINPDDVEKFHLAVVDSLENNHPYVVEFRMSCKDGHSVWIQSAGSVVSRDSETGEALRMCGTHLDITKRKKEEHEREEFFKFFQMSEDVMVIGDLSGKFVKGNPATLSTFGYSEQEFLSMAVTDIVFEDDMSLTVQEHLKQIKVGNSLNFENRCVCKDGSIRWLSWRASYDIETGVSYATGRDITQQKEVEEELKKQEAMYRALAENSEDVIMHYDRQHRHIYTNPAVSKLLPFTPADFEGKTNEEMGFPEEFCILWRNSIEQAFITGQPQSEIFEFVGNNDETFIIDWNTFPGLRNNGEVSTVFSVSRNITKYKKAEEELLKMQKLNSLGVLAGGIAHDFNNILTILFGNISLAKSQLSSDDDSFKILEKAERAFHRATHLTSQLLTFAKGGDPVKQDVSINDLVSETINFDLSGSNVKLNLESDDDLWMAKADKGQIAQVISNLAINADQAMPEGGCLHIKLENVEVSKGELVGLKAGPYIKFIIRDEGIGIQGDQLDRIFDPYYTTKQAGSGLGLATVYSIISKHGGSINVSSTSGKGTSFLVYLPSSGRALELGSTMLQEAAVVENKAMRILIMDDEEMICNLAQAILKGCGYIVESAKNGETAIDLYRASLEQNDPIDCVIMDLTIPGGMGGEEAINKILEINPKAKVLVSSGYAADPVMANYSEYGFRGVITKPFTIKSLREAVNSLLRQ